MQEDSLKKRYIYKLLTNIISLPLALIVQALTPRVLGPVNYGNFNFVTRFFTSVIGFLDSGTSTAFYTKLSQRQKERELLKFYWIFVIFVFVCFVFISFLIIIIGLDNFVWPEQTVMWIFMALIWAWLTWSFQIVQKILDALGYTKQSELIRMTQKIISCLVLVLLFVTTKLSLNEYFIYQYSIILFYIVGCTVVLMKKGISIIPNVKVNYKNYLQEFYKYSAPLVVSSFVILLSGLVDNWFVQKFYGSEEQGYFGLAYQVGAVCFIFSSAMSPIFMREFSIAHSENNINKQRYLFLKLVPLLYFVAAYIAIFASFQAETVMLIMGGEDYRSSVLIISVMAFYPLHQTYGQLCSSVFYAKGETKKIRNVGLIIHLFSLPVSFILIVPTQYYGLGFGGLGLAVKLVLVQIISVNALLYYISKMINIKIVKLLVHQFLVILILCVLSYISKIIFADFNVHYVIKFLLSGIVYTLAVLLIILIKPKIIAIRPNFIHSMFQKVKCSLGN